MTTVPEENEHSRSISRLDINTNIFHQDVFNAIGIVGSGFGLNLPQAYELTGMVARDLCAEIVGLNKTRSDLIDDFVFVLNPESAKTIIQQVPAIMTTDTDLIAKFEKHNITSFQDRKKFVMQLFEQFTSAAPAWMLYLYEYKDFYNLNGDPKTFTLIKPELAAPTYSSWSENYQEKVKNRYKTENFLAIQADSPGMATKPTQPPGKRLLRRIWSGRASSETTRPK